MKAGNADVSFTNSFAGAAKGDGFRPALRRDRTRLGGAGSPITSSDLAAIDQKGCRIGVAADSTSESTLPRDLKNAEVVRAATNQQGAELVAASAIGALCYQQGDAVRTGRQEAGPQGAARSLGRGTARHRNPQEPRAGAADHQRVHRRRHRARTGEGRDGPRRPSRRSYG